MAPPLQTVHESDGRVHAEVTLGAAYEGPWGLVHGGVVALLLLHHPELGDPSGACPEAVPSGPAALRAGPGQWLPGRRSRRSVGSDVGSTGPTARSRVPSSPSRMIDQPSGAETTASTWVSSSHTCWAMKPPSMR